MIGLHTLILLAWTLSSPLSPDVVGFATPFYRVFSSFFRSLAFPGCPSFCGSHLRLWLCLRFAHPVITAPFSRPIVTIIRRSLRPPLPLVLLYRRSLSSVHNLVEWIWPHMSLTALDQLAFCLTPWFYFIFIYRQSCGTGLSFAAWLG